MNMERETVTNRDLALVAVAPGPLVTFVNLSWYSVDVYDGIIDRYHR